jgi:hypothetical protein
MISLLWWCVVAALLFRVGWSIQNEKIGVMTIFFLLDPLRADFNYFVRVSDE